MADDAAWSQGWNLGERMAQEGHAHKQVLQDEELQGKIQQLVDNRKAIQGKLPTLLDDNGNPTPKYTQAIGDLTKNAQDLRMIYHPEKNPGAVEKFGYLLTDALHLTKPEDRIAKEGAKRAAGAAGDEKTAQMEAAAAPVSPIQAATQKGQAQAAEDLAYVNSSLKSYDQQHPDAVGPNATPEAKQARQDYATSLLQRVNGTYEKPKTAWVKLPDGSVVAVDANHPEAYPFGAKPYKEDTLASIGVEEFKSAVADGYKGTIFQFKQDSVKSKAMQAEWTRAHYGGRDMDQLSPKEADQAMAKYQEEKSPLLTSTGQGLVFDQQNQPHVFTRTSTSRKTYPGANDAATASSPTDPSITAPSSGTPTPPGATPPPKTLGHVKEKAAALNPPAASSSKSPIGPALDFKKMTPELTAANKKYNDAVGLVSFADKVQKNPTNPQEQRQFAMAMARTMANRFQMQEYDLEVKNSGLANTFQQWLNNMSTGALPQNIIDHLVQSAHDYKDATAEEVKAAKGTTTSPNSMTDDEFLLKVGK